MRSSPTLSETIVSLSFFLTTPARKPRTECGCQSVAFMIAAIVVPFGCRSIPRTVSCLEPVDLAEAAFGVAPFDRAKLRFADRAGRVFWVMRLADFDLDFLVAIWLSLMSTTASGAATDTSPAIERGQGVGPRTYPCDNLFNSEVASCTRLAS